MTTSGHTNVIELPDEAVDTAGTDNATSPPLPDAGRQATDWKGVLDRFIPRLAAVGFDATEVPSPDDLDAFPVFLAQLQVKDPLLASDLSRTVRRFRDTGALPDAGAQSRRERKRAAKQAATMRVVDGKLVKDKRKAPFYGLAALLLVVGPLGYMLSRPVQKTPPMNADSGVKTTQQTTKEETTQTEGTGSSVAQSAKKAVNQAGQLVQDGAQAVNNASQQPGGITGTLGNGTATAPASSPSSPPAPAGTTATSTPASSNRNNSNSGLNYGASSPPPTVSPPPVVTPPVYTQRPAEPDVYTPVEQSPSFGRGVSSPTATARPAQPQPVQITPIAQSPSFGEDVSTPATSVNTPSSTAYPVTTAGTSDSNAGGRAAGSNLGNTAIATPAPLNSSAAPARASNTAIASERVSNTAAAPAPIMTAPKTVPPVNAAQASNANTDSGQTFGNTVTPPAGLSPMGTVAPEAAPVQRRPATSGLVYERKRPETPAPAPAAAAPAAEVVSSSGPAVSTNTLFGNVESSSANATGAAESEKPFGSDASVPSSRLGALGPFRNLQQIPVRLVTAIYTLTGASVPVLVVTADGGSFVGVATINGQLARVDLTFRRYVAPDGNVSDVDALAYTLEGKNLTQGIPAKIVPAAPTLAIDAAQNGASALQGAVQSALQSMNSNAPQVAVGEGATIAANALPPLWQILAGGVSKTFALPQATQSIVRAAKVDTDTPMTLIVGLGAGN